MKQITLKIHDNFADKLLIGAVGQGGENITTCTILLEKNSKYIIGSDGILRPCGIESEVPR